jgi:hypothetical protein
MINKVRSIFCPHRTCEYNISTWKHGCYVRTEITLTFTILNRVSSLYVGDPGCDKRNGAKEKGNL